MLTSVGIKLTPSGLDLPLLCLLSFCSSSYSLRSCSNKLLQVPRSKLKSYGDRRFSVAGPKLWNSIPASLRNAASLNSFKKHLKTYLFHQAFS